MHNANSFKGQPRRCVLWELVPSWYKSFQCEYFGQTEMNDSTMLSNTDSTKLWYTTKFMHVSTEQWVKIFFEMPLPERKYNEMGRAGWPWRWTKTDTINRRARGGGGGEETRPGGANDIGKAESSKKDPRATGGLVSDLSHPRINQTSNTPSNGGEHHWCRWRWYVPRKLGSLYCWDLIVRGSSDAGQP